MERFTSMPRLLRQFLVSREFGGAADIALHLAREWRDVCGGEVEAWLPGEGRAADVARAAALPIRWYDLDSASAPSKWRAARANLTLCARLAASPAGIQHIHTPMAYGALWRAFRRARGPSIVHVHLDYDIESMRWAFRRPPAVIVTCARFMEARVREALPTSHRDQQRVVAIPNAVNTDRFYAGDRRAAKAKLGAPADRPLVLMLANLAPHKGQRTAVRAMAELMRGGLDACCWLAGVDRAPDAPFRTELEREIESCGMTSHVTLLGFRGDAPDLLRAADLLLLPSTSEGLPLTVLEAQASRVPVLAAPTAGVPEIIRDGETGFLIDADDYLAYAARMRELLLKESLRECIAHAAHEQCLRAHGWAAYFARICALYDELLESPRPARAVKPRARSTRSASPALELPTLNRVTCDESLA